MDETAIESNWFDDNMDMPSSQREMAKKNASADQISDSIVTNRCDDYESEMSPLVYHSSESDADNNESVDTITGTPTENVTSTYSKQRHSKTKETLNSDNSEDNARILRSQQLKRRLRSSDTKHQNKSNSINRKTISKTKKKSKSNQRNVKATEKSEQSADSCCSSSTTTTTTTSTTKSSIVSHTRKKGNTLTWSQDTNTSDIQLVQEDNMTPITISSSADTLIASQNESFVYNPNFTTQSFQASPDIFSSFTEQTEVTSIAGANSTPSTSPPIPAGQSKFVDNQSKFDGSQTICTQDIFDESQDIVNTTNPIQALNTTTSDIFEITRNNVFHNVLKVNNADAMTPVKNSDNVIPTKSCFSGVRLILPRLKSDEILELQREVAQRARNSQTVSSEDLIDLTAESQLNAEISSEDGVAMVDVEKTPQRKRPLTPTTRSCVRRSSDEIYISSDDDTPSKSTSTRSGWLSKRTSNVTSPYATPHSRRRLDKWFPLRTNTTNSNRASKCTQSVLQPRNIFEKRRPKQIEHLQSNSRSMLESPSIFSSDDE